MEEKICKNCAYWDQFVSKSVSAWGSCKLISFPYNPMDTQPYLIDFDIECKCDDVDTIRFETQDEFGCIYFETK